MDDYRDEVLANHSLIGLRSSDKCYANLRTLLTSPEQILIVDYLQHALRHQIEWEEIAFKVIENELTKANEFREYVKTPPGQVGDLADPTEIGISL